MRITGFELATTPKLLGDLRELDSHGSLTPAAPTKDLAEDLMATWARCGSKLPTLKGVTGNSILRADGSIFDSPGYDPETQLYYAPADELVLEAMPESPTRHEIEEAVATLDDVFYDFPFDGDSSRCHLMALLITHVCRHLIDGQTPLFLLDKPKVGTGASLLVDVVSAIASGKPATMRPAPSTKEEWRKDITAIVLDGAPLVVFDNVSGTINADPLAGVITANSWSDRRVGYSETTGELPTGHITWVMTGTNIQLRSDLARRSVSIRLDAKSPRPWQGRTFRHKALLTYVKKNRGRLLSAVFTLMRAWMNAGRPVAGTEPLGSFEEWSKVVGGVCEFAGIKGFLANRNSLYENMDEDHTEWLEFLSAIHDQTGGEPFLAKNLQFGSSAIDPDCLPLQLTASFGKPEFVTALGRAFTQKKDARYDELHLEQVSNQTNSRKAKVWRVGREELAK